MRHFFLCRAALRLAPTPVLLAGRVSARSPGAALVTNAGGSLVQPPLLLRACSIAVNMPGIALAANTHRNPAALALVSPERPLSHRNAIPLQGLDNAVRHVHKRAVELPLARTAPKARGLTAKSCPGPSPLRRQLLRITKMRGIAMPDNNRHLRRRRATALPLSQIHSAVTRPTPGYSRGTIFGEQDRTNFG
jgi:hypothetical protein